MAPCRRCGRTFETDFAWKKLCYSCWCAEQQEKTLPLECSACGGEFGVKPGDFRIRKRNRTCGPCYARSRSALRDRSRSQPRYNVVPPIQQTSVFSTSTSAPPPPPPAAAARCKTCQAVLPGVEHGPEECKLCFTSALQSHWRDALRPSCEVWLEELWERHKSGYEQEEAFSARHTGYNPFKDAITRDGSQWLLDLNHKNYKLPEDSGFWDPKRIIEAHLTLLLGGSAEAAVMPRIKALEDSLVEAPARLDEGLKASVLEELKSRVDTLKSAPELQLKQCCDEIRPYTARMIHRVLRDKFKTHCRSITRVFARVFQALKEKDARAFEAADIEERVKLACGLYMRRDSRAAFDAAAPTSEAQAARDRRDLVLQMVEKFRAKGWIEPHYNGGETDVIYTRASSGGADDDPSRSQVLFENPDLGAVHVFKLPLPEPRGAGLPPRVLSMSDQRARIFSVFRDFNEMCSQQQTLPGGAEVWPRFLDTPHLRHEAEDGEKGRAARYFQKLHQLPEAMRAVLLGESADGRDAEEAKKLRPSLHDFVGYVKKFQHRNVRLTERVFVKTLGLAEEIVKEVEKECVEEIKQARGGEEADFGGGTWHQFRSRTEKLQLI